MNTKFIASSLIAVAALASSAAFADEVDSRIAPAAVASQLSSAEVQAGYLKAVKEGTLPMLADASAAKTKTFTSNVSRADVKAQAYQSAHAKNKPMSEIM